jgi:hypothetical protein
MAPASAWANPPDAPAQPTVTPGNAQILVAFDAPADNGTPITSYTADCTSSDTGAFGTFTDTAPTDPATPITVSGLTNGSTYTCTVTASNGTDTATSVPSEAVIPVTVPEAPATPSVTSGDSQILVSFTAPNDGGSPITSYSAACESTDGGNPGSTTDLAPTDPATPITVSSLTNGSTYTCTVTATNAVGAGDPSPPSNSIVPATLPDAPPQPTVVPGNALIVVSFGAAGDGGSAITSYTASCESNDGGTSNSDTAAGSPNTVTGLTNGKHYTCTVTATNAVGTGPASDPSLTAVPSTTAAAPTIGAVTRGNASGSVAFTPGADNGSPVTSFTASCISSTGGFPGAHSGPTSPIVVTGLSNGYTYTCKVTATNANGTSAPSAASAAFVPATVPAAPTIGAIESGNASASVSFTPNSGNGSPITKFTARCTSANGGATGSGSGTAAPVTVPGLTNGSIYTCTVAATNAVGTGPQSAVSHALVVGQPTEPTNVKVISGYAPGSTGPLKVLFTAAVPNGSAITSYGASCVSTNGGVPGGHTGTASPISVAGLTTGKTYNCRVVATNARGTSFPSNAGKGIVGAPAAPNVLRVLPIKHGVAIPFGLPANNGAAISSYRARCTSTNGGAPGNPLQNGSPIVATGLTDGKTYTCVVTANNARGEGAPTTTASFVAGALNLSSLANCSGSTGTVTASPGFLYTGANPQTIALNTTLGFCSGPYVSSAHVVMSFHSQTAISCQSAFNVNNGGFGTITWTSPGGMGKSSASMVFVITSTSGHTTKVHYSGTVTSLANVFTGNHLSGNLTLNRGLHTVAGGGDCSATQPLTSFSVSAASLIVS